MKTRGMLQKRKTKTMQTGIEARLISFFAEVRALAWDILRIHLYNAIEMPWQQLDVNIHANGTIIIEWTDEEIVSHSDKN